MNPGPLDFRPIPLGRGIVDGQQDARGVCEELIRNEHQHAAAEFLPAAADALQEVIVVLIVVAESGGANPGGDDASPLAEEQAAQEQRQPPAGAAVESGGDPVGPVFPIVRRVLRCHPWLSGAQLMR